MNPEESHAPRPRSTPRSRPMATPSSVHRLFARFAARRDPALCLAEGSLLIALEDYPKLSLEKEMESIEGLAARLQRRLQRAPRSLEDDLVILRRFLFEEEGFRGDPEALVEPEGHYLHEVLRRRRGIPVSLSILLLAVGTRAGLSLRGINFPGRFLVRAERGDEVRILDAFAGGRLVERDDCREILEACLEGRLRFEESMLRPASPREVLVRVLRNLKGLFLRRGDVPRALSAVDRVLLLVPDAASEMRDRGLLLGALGHPEHGYRDLLRYLALSPGAPDSREMQAEAEWLRLVAGARN